MCRAFSLLVLSLYAQHRCGTEEYMRLLMQRDPSIAFRRAAIEAQTQAYIEELQRFPSFRTENVITIPVVVHVVYRTASENITDDQVRSQITVLNEDFRRQNADRVNTPSMFAGVAADAEIQFCLATRDPEGNPTSGITRTQTNRTSFSLYTDDVKFSSRGGKDAWPTDQYLNIWVCRLEGGVLGYAQLPGAPAETDGIVIDYRYFGRGGSAQAPFNRGRTTTHEVGHWLNLHHIWGNARCGDDYVNDTPLHEEANYGCPSFPKPAPVCGNNRSEMFMNYMDYTDDACMNLFTVGQKNRMRAVLSQNGYRRGLLSSPGCLSPGSCAGMVTLTAPSGSFSDGSGNYPHNADCRWLIQPPNASSITLSFRSFQLLGGDSVIVYDGSTTSAPRLGAFSGSRLPPNLTSTGGSMLVRFVSNASENAAGFEASYTAVVPTFCGGTQLLTSNSGRIEDGSGQGEYRDDADCRWVIRPSEGVGIRIEFEQFQTEPDYDFVSIYDGSRVESRYMVRRFSGNDLPPIITTAIPEATVYFTTDESITDQGWSLRYTTISQPYCSGTTILTAPSGTITDGSGNSDYTNRVRCSWLIRPPGASFVRLRFTEFNTEANYDFVRIYDGTTTNAALLGSYSGRNLPPTLTANSGAMLIVFTSDSSITRAGWTATYSSDAVANITPASTPLREVRFYPVPVQNTLWVSMAGQEPSLLYIYDTAGRIIWTGLIEPGENAISTEQWASGLYLAVLYEQGQTISFRFLRE